MVILRRRELLAAAVAASALGVDAAWAQSGGVDRLERLLVLELRLEAAYRAALARDSVEPELGRMLLAHEREHVRGVEVALRALGDGRPRATATPPPPAPAFASRRTFARFALALEEETVAAYAELLATLDAPGLLQPLGSIMASGAQHQVALRAVLGENLLSR